MLVTNIGFQDVGSIPLTHDRVQWRADVNIMTQDIQCLDHLVNQTLLCAMESVDLDGISP
jgi:hypothetical protein